MISNYMASALLNHFFNGNAMPNMGTLYMALHGGIPNSQGEYPEVLSSIWTNYKRAGVPRSTVGFPLVTTGRVGSNGMVIGNGTSGSLNSFLSTGTGIVLSGTSSITVSGIGIWDSATGGNLLFYLSFNPINGVTTRTLSSNAVFSIEAGALQISFATSNITDFEARNYINVALNGMGFSRGYYEIGFLTSLSGAEVTTSSWTNYKRAKITRDSTSFPVVSGKTINNGTIIGNGVAGEDNSFLTTGSSVVVSSPTTLVGIGIYDHQGNLCWTSPHNSADGNFILTNGASISSAVSSIAIMIQ